MPAFILEKLSEDKDWEVCYWVAYNPNVSNSILEKLSEYWHYLVRIIVTRNPNTPIYIVKKLSKDKDANVHQAAIQRMI